MFRQIRFRSLVLPSLACALAAAVVGCSGSHEAGPPVKGKVALAGGKPLTTGVVIFSPDPKKGNTSKHEARGKIDAQGEYELTSDVLGQQGIPPGWYRVTVVATTKNPRKEYAVQKSLIPWRYASRDTSRISFEVKEDAPPNAYDIRLIP
jgi:hypothetical protein